MISMSIINVYRRIRIKIESKSWKIKKRTLAFVARMLYFHFGYVNCNVIALEVGEEKISQRNVITILCPI